MAYRKGLSRDQIENAMRNSKSNNAAARYMGVAIVTYRKYAKMYYDDATGKTLYEKHCNPYAIGIKKGLKNNPEKDQNQLMDIIEGKVLPTSYTPQRLRNALIKEKFIKEECALCGFKEQRIHDYKVPLLLTFRDGDKRNWKLDNLELLCYNHFFLMVGEVFTQKQIEAIQGLHRPKNSDIQDELQIEDQHMPMVKDVYRTRPIDMPPEDTSGESLLFKM